MEELEYLSASAFFGRAGAACIGLRLCPRGLGAGAALSGNLFAKGGGSAQDEWVGGMAQAEEPNFGATKRRHPVKAGHAEAEEASERKNDHPEKAGCDQ